MRTLLRLALEGLLAVVIVVFAVALRTALQGIAQSQARRPFAPRGSSGS